MTTTRLMPRDGGSYRREADGSLTCLQAPTADRPPRAPVPPAAPAAAQPEVAAVDPPATAADLPTASGHDASFNRPRTARRKE